MRDQGTVLLPRDFQFGGIQDQHPQDQDGYSVHFLASDSSLNEPSTSAAEIPVLFMAPCQVGARSGGGRSNGFLTVGGRPNPRDCHLARRVTERTCLQISGG